MNFLKLLISLFSKEVSITKENKMDFLTEDKLTKILVGNKQIAEWYQALINNLEDFEINSVNRVAAFLSQTGHESNNYTVLSENLNYSADALVKLFSKHFTAAEAPSFARQPQKIANRLYCNRMGNGSEVSGDGWSFRGRGILQLTGKANYQLYSTKIYNDDTLISNPDLLANDKDTSIKAACYFWQDHGLNNLADVSDTTAITKKINGGTIGLPDRLARFQNDLKILA
jgi:putative chitinase